MATSHPQVQRDYKAAVEALNTLQSNFAAVAAVRKLGPAMHKNAMPEMIDWCRRTGYECSEFDFLDVIHIAGTKGKGSTSAFVSSILCQYQSATPLSNGTNSVKANGDDASHILHKVGLYTSPHLRSVRERISINGEPISEFQFAHYFWSVWDRLEDASKRLGAQALPLPEGVNPLPDDETPPKPTKPMYFRYLTLMALHAYKDLDIRPAVLECGMGGEYDSTNVIVSPSVCAVTSLDIDHVAALGSTIEEIAWHKAGIFKAAAKTREVYTVDSQPESAMLVLEQRAKEKGLTLKKVPRHSAIATDTDAGDGSVQLGLSADFQKTNASLAIAVAAAYLHSIGISRSPSGCPIPIPGDPASKLPPEFIRGLETVKWGGRAEVKQQGRVRWCLDGAHTVESLKGAGRWFGDVLTTLDSTRRHKRILLFNQQTRNADALARILHGALAEIQSQTATTQSRPMFDHALFSTNLTFAPSNDGTGGSYKPDLISMNTSGADVEELVVQKRLAETWSMLDAGCEVEVSGTIEDAVRRVRAIENAEGQDCDVTILVTGSLHLVGGCLEVLDVTAP